MSELFCIGSDEYKPNTVYVIGPAKNKLYSHVMNEHDVIYTESAHDACAFEHFTDAQIHIHGLKNDRIRI